MTFRTHNLNKALNKMTTPAAKTGEIAFDVQKSNHIDDATSRLLIKVPAVFANKINDASLSASIAARFPDVRYLPESAHYVGPDRDLIGVFVKRNRQTLSMEKANTDAMTQVSDTVFQDADDVIWSVVRDGESAFLVAEAQEDIASLLGAVRTRAIATASVGVQLSEDFAAKEFIKFYDFAQEKACFGIAVDGRTVYSPDRDALIEVASDQVISVHSGQMPDMRIETAASGDKKALLDYMRTLYGHNKEFLRELETIINQHTTV